MAPTSQLFTSPGASLLPRGVIWLLIFHITECALKVALLTAPLEPTALLGTLGPSHDIEAANKSRITTLCSALLETRAVLSKRLLQSIWVLI